MTRTTSSIVPSNARPSEWMIDGIVRHAQRRDRAAAVEVVAPTQVGEDGLGLRGSGCQVTLRSTAPRPLLEADVEVELQVGIRQHDRADVATGHDDAARRRRGRRCELEQRGADVRLARDGADLAVDLRGVRARR